MIAAPLFGGLGLLAITLLLMIRALLGFQSIGRKRSCTALGHNHPSLATVDAKAAGH